MGSISLKIQFVMLLSPLLLTVSCMQASIDSLQAANNNANSNPPLTETASPQQFPEYESKRVSKEEEIWEAPRPVSKVPDTQVPDEVKAIIEAAEAEEAAKNEKNEKTEKNEVTEVTLPEVKDVPTPRSRPEEQPKESTAELPKETKENKEPKKSVTVEQAKSDMSGPGVLKPTVYYFVVINEDDSKCEKDTDLHGSGGKVFLKVCKKTADACGLQGSCGVVQNGVTHTFNIVGRKNGQDRYFKIEKDGCRYGYGVRSSCLDPFYTLAADLKVYKPGEVIYVPGVVGTVLPDGSKHSGYFVIRDQGRGINGTGRFDFFTGPVSWLDSKNPFSKIGLGDVKTNIPYFRVTGKTAQQVLANRAYPELPSHLAVAKKSK